MDSAREAAAATNAVISPNLWAMLIAWPPPGWLFPPQFKLGIGEDTEGPFVPEKFETTKEMEEVCC